MLLSGCQTAGYYAQAIRGEYQVLSQRQSVAEMMAKPTTDPLLRQKFELIERLRAFAAKELGLPIHRHYQTYVDLHRRFAVWNVHAAPAYSLEPKKWWYPMVGSLKYRGYFSEADARAYAAKIATQGYDVYTEGVEAYSTLGWFADPLLNTFIYHSEPELAEILFHELTHQRLFVNGDTDFNEAFATVVAEEGVRRWLTVSGNSAGRDRYELDLERNRQFVSLVMNTRRQLHALYGEPPRGPARAWAGRVGPAWMCAEKEAILARSKEDYAYLKTTWGGVADYDGWFNRKLNNAQLNTIAVYYDLVPGLQALLRSNQGQFAPFYAAVRDLGKLPKAKRHQRLHEWSEKEEAGRRDGDQVQQGSPIIH